MVILPTPTSSTILKQELPRVSKFNLDFGYVEFNSKEDSLNALGQRHHFIEERLLTVEMHKSGQALFQDYQKRGKGFKNQIQTFTGTKDGSNPYLRLCPLDYHQSQMAHEGQTRELKSESKSTQNANLFSEAANIRQKTSESNQLLPYQSPTSRTLEASKKNLPSTIADNYGRKFKFFYQHLKRTHVQIRQASRLLNEANYVYRRMTSAASSRYLSKYLGTTRLGNL